MIEGLIFSEDLMVLPAANVYTGEKFQGRTEQITQARPSVIDIPSRNKRINKKKRLATKENIEEPTMVTKIRS